ncbi:uncharacterized protein L203_105270 [Cryptococcus depauperatus CBS 7841]|uniref:Cullin family profile domain-containing protein n=1 Tax=Cryptococcus depauperatus CBS 7841 TaxID=1295531 RepID=A0AAJ8JX09_9TREE
MSPILIYPSTTDAFSDYRPSSNAHTDILQSESRQHSTRRNVRLQLKPATVNPAVQLSSLLSSISAIFTGQPTPVTYHRITSLCRNIVLRRHDDEIVAILSKFKEESSSLCHKLATDLKRNALARDRDILQKVLTSWKTWETRINLVLLLFTDIEVYLKQRGRVTESMSKHANNEFAVYIWSESLINQTIQNHILNWIQDEIQFESPSALRSQITAVAKLSSTLLENLDHTMTVSYFYEGFITDYYYKTIRNFYSEIKKGHDKCANFMSWLIDKMSKEAGRSRICLEGQELPTYTRIYSAAKDAMGRGNLEEFIRSLVKEIMVDKDILALGRLCRLMEEFSYSAHFASGFESYIQEHVKDLISDPINDPHMIEDVLQFKRFAEKAIDDLFYALVNQASKHSRHEDCDIVMWEGREEKQFYTTPSCGHDSKLQSRLYEALRNGFKLGLATRQNAPAEWTAKHLDITMRKGPGTGTEEDFNRHLDEIIILVGIIKAKDVFRAFYSSSLAKRLLLGRSASDDMEKNMIMKLKQELGDEFTTGDVMMRDLHLSETLMQAYQTAQIRNSTSCGPPFIANVLTESAWPAYPLLKDGWSFHLTPELQSSIDSFMAWYNAQHKNRVLSWRWQLATVVLTTRFPSGWYEVGVSLFQAVTLLQFNEVDRLTFTEIKGRTGIENKELIRTLQSLALGKKGTRVLAKKPPGKEVALTDVFLWNKGFTSERIKFKINQIQHDMTAEESRKTNERVILDRVAILEAAIVRIMKARKTITLQLLIDAVVTDVSKKFPPDIKDIKKRVENLIEREFMSRDDGDRGVLHYIA